jgi:hypothetical protein
MMMSMTPVIVCGLAFAFLLVTQRWFQAALQHALMALTRDNEISLYLYAILFAPGVAVHELSHWLAAWCLRVRTVSFSLVPKKGRGGQLRLGYVETERPDPIRGALIGAAPLLSGVALLTLLTLNQLALGPVVEAMAAHDAADVVRSLAGLPTVPDLGLWLYLVVTISNTMLPSAADRSAWLPAAAIVLALGLILAWMGLQVRDGGWLALQAQAILPRLSAVFGLTAALNMLLACLFWVAGVVLFRARRLIPN